MSTSSSTDSFIRSDSVVPSDGLVLPSLAMSSPSTVSVPSDITKLSLNYSSDDTLAFNYAPLPAESDHYWWNYLFDSSLPLEQIARSQLAPISLDSLLQCCPLNVQEGLSDIVALVQTDFNIQQFLLAVFHSTKFTGIAAGISYFDKSYLQLVELTERWPLFPMFGACVAAYEIAAWYDGHARPHMGWIWREFIAAALHEYVTGELAVEEEYAAIARTRSLAYLILAKYDDM